MRKSLYIWLPILIFVMVLGIACNKTAPSQKSDKTYKKITSPGQVEISLVPSLVKNDKLQFKMRMNTHSVSLSQLDLKKLITLETSDGSIHPSDVPKLSGHHSGGTVTFDLKKPVDKIKVIIRDVPDKPERVFEW